MILTLSQSQMLEQWRLRRYLEPSGISETDHDSVEHIYSNSDTQALTAEMRAWYLNLLDTAHPMLLSPEDIADRVALKPLAPEQGIYTLRLPDNCRRPLSLTLGQNRPAAIVDHDSPAAALQASPLCRGGARQPIAVANPDRSLTIYAAPAGESLQNLIAIVTPPDGFYTLDERALGLIQPI